MRLRTHERGHRVPLRRDAPDGQGGARRHQQDRGVFRPQPPLVGRMAGCSGPRLGGCGAAPLPVLCLIRVSGHAGTGLSRLRLCGPARSGGHGSRALRARREQTRSLVAGAPGVELPRERAPTPRTHAHHSLSHTHARGTAGRSAAAHQTPTTNAHAAGCIASSRPLPASAAARARSTRPCTASPPFRRCRSTRSGAPRACNTIQSSCRRWHASGASTAGPGPS